MLRVTSSVMQNIVRLCRVHSPQETCGFVVASKETPDLGTRMIWMQNMHPKPTHHYRMDDAAVRMAYQEFDATGEEPIAIFHSHPTSAPLMSQEDLEQAQDTSLAYLIVSLETKPVKAKAFRVEHFIGNSLALPVPIVLDDSQTGLAALPAGPWALMTGNRVRISYQRTNKTSISVNVSTVTGCNATEVMLDPQHKSAARMIPLERIRSVHVLQEGPLAVKARARLATMALQARSLMAGHEVVELPELLAVLGRAFPSTMAVSMENPR